MTTKRSKSRPQSGGKRGDPQRFLVLAGIGVVAVGIVLAWGTSIRPSKREVAPTLGQSPSVAVPSLPSLATPGPTVAPPSPAHARPAVAAVPTETLSAAGQAAMQQGSLFLNTGHLPEAAAEFKRGTVSDPHAPIMHAYLGMTYYRQKRYAEALKQYQVEESLLPSPALAWAHKADIYYAQGDLPTAIHYLEKAVALQPGIAQFYFNLAMLYPQEEELSKAIDTLGQYLALEPDKHYAHYLRADLLDRQSREDEAQAELEQAIRLAPNVGLYHYVLGKVLLTRQTSPESTQQARAELEQALQDNAPEPDKVHYQLAICYQRANDWKAEQSELETTIQLAPKFGAAYHALRDVLMRQGQVEAARKAEAKFLELQKQAEPSRERAFFEQEAQRNPDSPDASYQLAAYLARVGDRAGAQKALAHAQRLAEGKPGNADLRRRMARLSSDLMRSDGH
jgi:tetratricopeptide (TPR) repeat protein